MVVRGPYNQVERMLMVFSLIYFTYPISAYPRPSRLENRARQHLGPPVEPRPCVHRDDSRPHRHHDHALDAVLPPGFRRRKGNHRKDLNLCRVDVILGCIVTDVVAFSIVVACAATIYRSNHREFTDAAEAAKALAPFAGHFAAMLFGVGLINASLMSAAILPLATTYNICEGPRFRIRYKPAIPGRACLLRPRHRPHCFRRGVPSSSLTFHYCR